MSDTISKTSDAVVSLSFSAAIDHLCEHIRQNIESCIPGRFLKWLDAKDKEKSIALVTPLVKFPYVSGNTTVWTERPELPLRVLRVKSGNFWFEMPLKEGDTGWIIAADRDTSYAIERNSSIDVSKNQGQQEYSNFNKLKYAFGFFIPDGFCNIKVADGHEGSSFWTKLRDDGSGERESFIELKDNGEIVLHGGGELDKTLVEGNLGVTKILEVRDTIRAEVDGDDPLEVVDTKFLVKTEDDKLVQWRGKTLRSKGENGEPFDFPSPHSPTIVNQGDGILVTGSQPTGYTITNNLSLTPGTNVAITGNAQTGYTISASGGIAYTAGSGISISAQNEISAHWV
jgi:hypothetical protein